MKRKAAGTLRVAGHGLAAHSGSAPDKGRNALLALAARRRPWPRSTTPTAPTGSAPCRRS